MTLKQLACPFYLILDIKINFILILRKNKFDIVKKSCHKKIEQISSRCVKHDVEPLAIRKKKVNGLVTNEFNITMSFLSNNFNNLLQHLKPLPIQPTQLTTNPHQQNKAILLRQLPPRR
jgi:hypothetical protein